MELVKTITSEEIVEQCKRGDTSAFSALYHMHSKEVYNTIYRLVPHTGEAEDLLQEVFVAAFQAIHRFENTGGVQGLDQKNCHQSIHFLDQEAESEMGGVGRKRQLLKTRREY